MAVPGPRSARERAVGPMMPIAHLLPRPIHYVMAGGGSHGAVQWGLAQALAHTDLRPDMIVGSSAGALTGSVLAEDVASGVHRIAYVWAQLDMRFMTGDRSFARRVIAATRSTGLMSHDAERETLNSILAARSFDDLELPFAAVATDLATGMATVLRDGDLISALLASSAIPGVLPPVEIGGRLYVDGLASANLPAVPAVELGAGSIVVLDTGASPPGDIGTSSLKVLGRVAGIMAASQRRRQLRDAASEVPVVLLPTPDDLGGTFDFADTMRVAGQSYAMGRAFLADLCAQPGTLGPGLYARADAHGVDAHLARMLQQVGP